jgi:hypothetical protein
VSYRKGPKLNLDDLAFLQECLDTILASRQIDPASGQAEVAAARLFRAHLCGVVEKAELVRLGESPNGVQPDGQSVQELAKERRHGKG